MSIVKINPSTVTKIAEGSCTVIGTNNNQLVYFTNKDELLDTSYLNDNAYIISDSPVFARSTYTELNINVISNVSAGASGAKGDKGEQGIPGVQGKQGIPGVKGADGKAGIKGDDGKAGAKGDPVLNIKDSKPLKIWAGTAEELALVEPKAPDVVYLVTGETV